MKQTDKLLHLRPRVARGLAALTLLGASLQAPPAAAQALTDCDFAGNIFWEAMNDLASAVPFGKSIVTAAKTGIALSKIGNNVACNSQGVAGLTLEDLTE